MKPPLFLYKTVMFERLIMRQSKNHPIVQSPWEYAIIEINYKSNVEIQDQSYLDLKLRKGKIIRRLRFYSPKNLRIEEGFPEPTGGMCILDISDRQLEGLNIEVADFENSKGSITFLAKAVIDLDNNSTSRCK